MNRGILFEQEVNAIADYGAFTSEFEGTSQCRSRYDLTASTVMGRSCSSVRIVSRALIDAGIGITAPAREQPAAPFSVVDS